MKRTGELLFVVFFIFIGVLICGEDENPWIEFILKPTKSNFVKCLDQIRESLSTDLEPHETLTYKQLVEKCSFCDYSVLGELSELVEEGDTLAGELLFALVPIFRTNPSISEENDATFGLFAGVRPEHFLRLAKRYWFSEELYRCKYPDRELKYALVALGERYHDELEKSLKKLIERRSKIERVTDEDLRDIKEKALRILDEDIKDYGRMLENMKKE